MEMTDHEIEAIEGDCVCGQRYELMATHKSVVAFIEFWKSQHRACHRREHDRLIRLMPRRPEDFAPWGDVDRDANDEHQTDCSAGCKWARWLESPLVTDWLVCTNPKEST